MQQVKERATADAGIRPGAYGTILVHAEPGVASSHRVEVAARLARDFGARLIGVGAEAFDPALMADDFLGVATAEVVGLLQDQISRNLKDAETAFRRDGGGADLEWRLFQDYPHRALTAMARGVDLIVLGPQSRTGATRTADPADVAMAAGRPVLLVPATGSHLRGKSIVVAWKDTRECRRAVTDAMPFLQRADDVIILTVVQPDQIDTAVFELDDVVANLKRHGVDARQVVTAVPEEQVTAELARVAGLNDADLIVAGAFGHSRLREWVLGGVTDDLLHQPYTFVLLSH